MDVVRALSYAFDWTDMAVLGGLLALLAVAALAALWPRPRADRTD